MWLYPLPCLVALVGWLFVYRGMGGLYIAIGATTLVVGLGVFLVWAARRGEWPFGTRTGPELPPPTAAA
jgi:hypothetical protein